MSGAYMKRSRTCKQKPGNPAAAVDFAAIEGELAGLPERAPDPRVNTKRRLIERLREPLLDAMVSRHQSPETLAELLGRWGIAIRPETLRRYLGPITEHRRRAAPPTEHRRRAAPPTDKPPTDKPPTDKPPTDDPSPARAGRGAASSERPGAGAVGSPEALARLESALADGPSGPPPVQPASPAARPRPDDPPYCPPGTFIPRPEPPIDWYKPSS